MPGPIPAQAARVAASLVFISIALSAVCSAPSARPPAPAPVLAEPPPAVPARPQPPAVGGRIIDATPGDYLARLRSLSPGDTLVLAPGTYDDPRSAPGLPVFNLHGTADAPITITGAGDPGETVLIGRATHNTIRFGNSSWVTVKNLTVDGRDRGGDGVKAQGIAHHITLENLVIRGVGGHQQVVGISTNGAPTWNWIIRGNTIIGAGTGLYLGNSDGTNPFVAGLIEHNVVRDTIGYNVQIKHQAPWPIVPGMPTQRTRTIVRHNVFSKGANSSTGNMARPNLLIGDVPPSGPGADNGYEVYGNFFYENPSEALFQAEGNVAFYSNLMVTTTGSAVHVQPHNGKVRDIRIFGNTVLAAGRGISISGGDPAYRQIVVGNAVFAAAPITAAHAFGNVTDSVTRAAAFLTSPTGALGSLDLFPKVGALRGPALPTSGLSEFSDWALDFNGRVRDWSFRGAYSGEGANPGWLPTMTVKPE